MVKLPVADRQVALATGGMASLKAHDWKLGAGSAVEGGEACALSLLCWFFSTTTVYAQSLYLRYDQWEQMPTSFREMYVAGAFDTLSVVAIPQQVAVARHYNECVVEKGLRLAQLAQGVKNMERPIPMCKVSQFPIY